MLCASTMPAKVPLENNFLTYRDLDGVCSFLAQRLVWKSTADLADRLPGPPSAPIATLVRVF